MEWSQHGHAPPETQEIKNDSETVKATFMENGSTKYLYSLHKRKHILLTDIRYG